MARVLERVHGTTNPGARSGCGPPSYPAERKWRGNCCGPGLGGERWEIGAHRPYRRGFFDFGRLGPLGRGKGGRKFLGPWILALGPGRGFSPLGKMGRLTHMGRPRFAEVLGPESTRQNG